MNTVNIARPADSAVSVKNDGFLRLALRLDAVATLGSGALMAAGGGLLAEPTGIPAGAAHGIGAFLVVYALAVGVLSFRPVINRAAAWTVVGLNTLWVIDSVATLVAGFWDLTAMGTGFIIVMAVVVAAFAELQYVGIRRLK